jgi:cytochrome c peroxidase
MNNANNRRVRMSLLATAILVTGLDPKFLNAQQVPLLPGLPDPLPALPDVLPSWFPPVWSQSLLSPEPSSSPTSPGSTPAVIAQYVENADATGKVATYQPAGPTVTAGNPYFTALGTNRRTCFTCHQPQTGWSMTPTNAQLIFLATKGTDPLFAPVDGANCPGAAVEAKSPYQKAEASSQMLLKGNVRIFLPIPAGSQFKVRILKDPYGCETSAKYGLPSGMISMYRRVLTSTNLTKNAQLGAPPSPQGAVMWDEREPTLESQFLDATLGHEQASRPPSSAEIQQGVAFESGLFTTQELDKQAGSLSTAPAAGGPVNLSRVGIPDTPDFLVPFAFNQFVGWDLATNSAQASISRGENIFNTTTFVVNGVAGFNDVESVVVPVPGPVTATCSTCHNGQNVGYDAVPGGRHLGIGDNSSVDKSGPQATATELPPTSDEPLFAFDCPVGSIPYFSNPVTLDGKTYDEYQTTDPGMGLISGKCSDLGKFKVPRLDGLAARPPYFHNGNAASIAKLIDFYDARFSIGLSAQDKTDLENFLNSL